MLLRTIRTRRGLSKMGSLYWLLWTLTWLETQGAFTHFQGARTLKSHAAYIEPRLQCPPGLLRKLVRETRVLPCRARPRGGFPTAIYTMVCRKAAALVFYCSTGSTTPKCGVFEFLALVGFNPFLSIAKYIAAMQLQLTQPRSCQVPFLVLMMCWTSLRKGLRYMLFNPAAPISLSVDMMLASMHCSMG